MISWRRKHGLVLGVLTVLVSLSGLAEAQVSGLFPLHPIRRERVPCPEEDPVYRLNRTQYFGYHPTVWRRFPDGWGFRSPEAANREKEFKELPIKPPEPPPPEEGDERDMEAPPDRGRPAIPNPPAENERSPFDMDRPNQGGAWCAVRRHAARPHREQPSPPGRPNPRFPIWHRRAMPATRRRPSSVEERRSERSSRARRPRPASGHARRRLAGRRGSHARGRSRFESHDRDGATVEFSAATPRPPRWPLRPPPDAAGSARCSAEWV